MKPYFFGIYHWRRRLRRLALAGAAVLFGATLWRQRQHRYRVLGVLVAVFGLRRAQSPLTRLLSPPPWRVQRRKYERLAAGIPLADADRVLDIGCGTGRSLVGLAPFLPADVHVRALDLFDDRVILGNGPGLAARNARLAGLSPSLFRGDARRLPVDSGSQDIVTISRVLHDLPNESDAETALAEIRRVLRPDGKVGILEVPSTHDDTTDGLAYWRERLTAAGFAVTNTERVDGYVVLHAELA